MSVSDGPFPEMRLFSGIDQPLSAADAERLLAGQGAAPGAPQDQQALAMMLRHAAGPACAHELADEAFAVAAFALVKQQKARRAEYPARTADQGRPAGTVDGRRWWQTRRRPLVAACASAAVLIALSGTAAANALPAPVQRLAHDTFGAPAPRHPAPSVSTTPGVRRGKHRLITPDATPGTPTTSKGLHGKGNGKGKAVGKDKPAKPTPHGLAKGHTAAHGHK